MKALQNGIIICIDDWYWYQLDDQVGFYIQLLSFMFYEKDIAVPLSSNTFWNMSSQHA